MKWEGSILKSLIKVLYLFLVSRVILFLALRERIDPYADDQSKMDHPLLDPFILYDSYNYAQIALQGYEEPRLTAFFPLYPLLVRGIVGFTGWDVYWVGFMLSNLFFILLLWWFDRLLEERQFSSKSRMIILLTIVFFPSSFFFSAFYTESFFLFLAILSFWLWDHEKKGWAYLVAGLATLTRIVGVCIPLAFFLDRVIRRKLEKKDVIFSFGTLMMFSLYPGYLWWDKGDPFLFLKVQEPFYHRVSVMPFYPIYQDWVWSFQKWIRDGWVEPIIIFHLMLFLVFIFYILKNIRAFGKGESIHWAEFLYTVGLTVFSLSSMLFIKQNIASHGYMRYFLPIFPLFIYIGCSLEGLFLRIAEITERKKRLLVKCLLCFLFAGWILMSIYLWMVWRFKGFVA